MIETGVRRRAWTCAVIGAVAVTGCGVEMPIYASDNTHALGGRATTARTWEPTASEPVTLEMQMASTVKPGGRLPIRLRLYNGSTRPVAIGYNQEQGFDVIIAMPGTSADSTAVWSPWNGSYSLARPATITDALPAGRDTTFEVVWPVEDDGGHRVPPGKYRVRAAVAAELLSTRQIWTPWMEIAVVP